MTASGGTVIVGLDDLPRGVLLWRTIVTWIGGIGVILLAMILLPVLNIGGMQLLRNADFNTLGKIMPRAKEIALSIGAAYAALTLACGLGYVWSGMSGFNAFTYAMSTVATGGMTNHDRSFADFTPAAQYVAIVFMLLGAMSFIRYVQIARGDPGRVPARHPDPGVPGDLRRLRAGAGRGAGAERRADRRAHGPRGALQPRVGDHHHRLRLDRLLALGAARPDAVLLRDDDLRLLRLDHRRPQGVPLPAARRRHRRRGAAAAQPERRPHPALPGPAGLERGARTRWSPSSCSTS